MHRQPSTYYRPRSSISISGGGCTTNSVYVPQTSTSRTQQRMCTLNQQNTPWSLHSQKLLSGCSSSVATIFACLDNLAHIIVLGRVISISGSLPAVRQPSPRLSAVLPLSTRNDGPKEWASSVGHITCFFYNGHEPGEKAII